MRLVPYLLISSMRRSNSEVNQGIFGEMKVASIFHPFFFGNDGQIIFNDVTIQEGAKKNKHQIDHIVILPYGIFVIETKNIAGRVNGELQNENWVLASGKTIYNPLLQNETHVRVVKDFLGLSRGVYSVVAFANSNKPKNINVPELVNLEDLKEYIKSFKGERNEINLTKEEMETLASELTVK